ncbi:hypothetical protein MKW92_024154 [Papaver armeniacum]|nr:hypothetical protein MKW92_024154 [Papaver armeniacum]
MMFSTDWADLADVLHGYISFMEDHFKESPDFIFLVYRHRDYLKTKDACAFLLKEYGKANTTPSSSNKLESQAAAQSEFFDLIEQHAISLDLSFDVASSVIAEVSTGQRLVEDIPVRIMSLMSFGVFVASWRLSSHDLDALQTQDKLRDVPQPMPSLQKMVCHL